ncbi:MAG TPA: tetratricopeptide repeat protein, partial [Novosphingobium sp.]|nr:tetratricopeptide repeat protein [Novosphingobium sp.]
MATLTNQSWLSRRGQYHPRLIEAAVAMNANDIPKAEFLLRTHLKERPFEVAAIRMLAEVAGRIGRYKDSETLLRRALELSPGFTAARANLALVLYRQNRPADAIAELNRVIAEEPENPGHANLQAAALGRIGEFEEAIPLYEKVLEKAPQQPRVWMSFGHMLKTVGRLDEGIAAYRKAIELMPSLGEAWWSLANLKTVRFDDADIAAMEAALASGDVAKDDRFHLDFALGKALEDRGETDAAFAHYAAANALRKTDLDYEADENERLVDRLIEVATPAYFAAREGQGCDAPDPIFVLGMPRAGSTLV